MWNMAACIGWWTTQGAAKDTKKRIYGQAFTLYALAEYYHAIKDENALAICDQQFDLIEKYSYDPVNGGYLRNL